MAEKKSPKTATNAQSKKAEMKNNDPKKEEVKAPPVVDSRPKKLYRLPKTGKVAGVCSGLAEYLDLDVTLLRIIFVVLTLASAGFGVLVYLIMALVMPVSGRDSLTTKNIEQRVDELGDEISDRTNFVRNLIGAGLILFGGWLLMAEFFPQIFNWNWETVWPLLLVVLGLILLVRSRD